MKTIIAIDPGKGGGIAFMNPDEIAAHPMPATQGDVLGMLMSIRAKSNECEAYIEDVPKFCGRALPASAIGVMFENYGFIKGALMALGIRLHLVRPQEWQSSFSLGTARSCKSKTEWKSKLKGEAQRLFPGIDVTLKTADALLILEHACKQP